MAQMQEPQREQPPREAAGRSYVPWSSSHVYLHALQDLKKYATNQSNGCQLVAKYCNLLSKDLIRMHPSAHLTCFTESSG